MFYGKEFDNNCIDDGVVPCCSVSLIDFMRISIMIRLNDRVNRKVMVYKGKINQTVVVTIIVDVGPTVSCSVMTMCMVCRVLLVLFCFN